MRFTVSHAKTDHVELFLSSSEPAPTQERQISCDGAEPVSQNRTVVTLSSEERYALPFALLPSVSCGLGMNRLSSTQSPALEVSPCASGIPCSVSVTRWEEAEHEYLYNSKVVEQRVIILIQEAYRASMSRLRDAHKAGCVSGNQFSELCLQLYAAASAVKGEYRRTLQRCVDNKGTSCDLACLASKAVNCVASVYPWSSDGFLLSFNENRLFQSVTASRPSFDSDALLSDPITTYSIDCVASLTTPYSVQEGGAAIKETSQPRHLSQTACANEPRTLKPPRTLQKLPPKKTAFQRVTLEDHSEGVRKVNAPQLLHPQRLHVPGSPLPGGGTPETASDGCSHAYQDIKEAAVPPAVGDIEPPPSWRAGLIRREERRFFERRQLTFGQVAFCVRSLASMGFVGYRRSNVAVWHSRQRGCVSKPSSPAESQGISPDTSPLSSARDDTVCHEGKGLPVMHCAPLCQHDLSVPGVALAS